MRRLGRTALILLAVVGLLAPALWIGRDVLPPQIARWAVNWAAGAEVIDDLAFRIADLSLHHLTVEDLRVNRDGAFTAPALRVDFDPSELLRGRLRTVAATGAALDVSVGPDGTLRFGSLDPAIAAFGATDGASADGPAPLQRLDLRDARIALTGAATGLIHLDGTVAPTPEGLSGTVIWRADVQSTGAAPVEVAASGRATLDHANGATTADFTVNDGGIRRGTLYVDGLRGTTDLVLATGAMPEVTAELSADRASAGGAALPAPYLHLRYDASSVSAVVRLGPADAAEVEIAAVANAASLDGRRAIQIDGRGDLARVDALIAAWADQPVTGVRGNSRFRITGGAPLDALDPAAFWAGTVASGGVTVDVEESSLPAPLVGRGKATVRLAVALAAGRLSVETAEPLQLSAVLEEALPEPASELVRAGPVALALGTQARPFRILLETPFEGARVGFDGPSHLVAAGGGVADLEVHGTFSQSVDGWTLDEPANATVAASGFHLNGIDIERLDAHLVDLTLTPDGPDGGFDIALRSSMPERGVSGAEIVGRGRFVSDAEGVRIHLTESGRLAVARLAPAQPLAPIKQFAARISMTDQPVLTLPSDNGPIVFRVPLELPSVTVDSAEPGGWAIALQPTRAVVEGTVDGDGLGSVRARFTGATAVVSPVGVTLEGLAADLRMTLAQAGAQLQRVDVRASRVIDRARLARFTPLSLEGFARGAGTASAPDRLAFRMTLHGADGAFVLDAEGHHAPGSGKGDATLTLFPIRFVPGGLQPADLSPAAAALFRAASGEVSLAGRLRWPGEAVPPDNPLTLTLNDLGFTGSLGTITGLNGSIALSRIDPPMTAPGQVLTAKAFDLGIPIVAPRVQFRLESENILRLERVEAQFADGRVTAQDVEIPLGGKRPIPVVLTVDRVDAARLAEAIDLDGLSATGTLSGWLPLVWDPASGLAIRQARLTTGTAGGTLRYLPDKEAPALQDTSEQVSLLLKAIRNFVYESFEVEADGRPGEPFDVKLRLRGANPDLFDGYPIALNVTLTGALDQLFGNLRRSLGLTDVIKRRLEASSGG